jgi:hypothetical protein
MMTHHKLPVIQWYNDKEEKDHKEKYDEKDHGLEQPEEVGDDEVDELQLWRSSGHWYENSNKMYHMGALTVRSNSDTLPREKFRQDQNWTHRERVIGVMILIAHVFA